MNDETQLDEQLKELFAPIRPRDDFEESILAKLREKPARRLVLSRWNIHPAVRTAAAAIAASLLVGTIGYFASERLESARGPRVASSFRQIGQARSIYANDVSDSLKDLLLTTQNTATSFIAPDLRAEKWDFSGGANSQLDWSNWNRATGGRNLSYRYQNPYASQNDTTAGFKLNESINGDFAVAPDAAPQRKFKSGNANNRDEDGQNILYGDGHVTFLQNPFTGVQRDNIYKTRPSTTPFTSKDASSPFDGNDSILLPVDGDDAGKQIVTAAPLVGMRVVPATQPAPGEAAALAVAVDGDGDTDAAKKKTVDQFFEQRSIIRTGTIELSVDSFEATFASIKKLVADASGYIGSINSEKLPNGRVRGTLVLRVPPDKTDAIVTALRPLGDVNRQNLAAEEVTKQIAELSQQLDTAKTMQDRLSELSNSKTGEVKDKVAAEHEAGEWRQRAQQAQTQIASLKNQVNLATITVVLAEKGLDAPASIHESETMDLGIEAEDVEKSRADASRAIEDAQGRILQSQLKQFDAGQLTARIVAEVSPERAGAVVDRLKQIGKVTRLDVQRQTSGNNGVKSNTARVERDNTQLVISLYNLANVQPRVTTTVNLAVENIEKSYREVIDRATKSGARILASNINRQQDGGGASVQFDLKTDVADATLNDIRTLGEVMRLDSAQSSDTSNVSSAKRGFVVQINSIASAQPREVTTRSIAASDVSSAYRAILEAVRKANARVIVSKLDQQGEQSTSGYLDFEIRRADSPAIEAAMASSGDVVGGNVAISSDTQNTLESKVQFKLTISPAVQLVPREATTLGIETRDVDSSLAQIQTWTNEVGGRSLDANVSKDSSGRSTARLSLDLPLDKSAAFVERVKNIGTVRLSQSQTNAQAPAGKLARARLDVMLATPDAIVQSDAGMLASIRGGLATSARGLLWSVRMIVIGLCLVAPWVLISLGAVKLYRRSRRQS